MRRIMKKINELTKEELYSLSRFMYKIGQSIISDIEYDALEKELVGDKRTDYNDDDIPIEVLRQVYTDEEINNLLSGLKESASVNLDRYVSRSMKSYRTLEECYEWINQNKDLEMCISPKIDGINTTTLFTQNGLTYSRTRGRAGRSKDLTENISKVLPKDLKADDLVVCGEAVYTADKLSIVNQQLLQYSSTTPIITPRGGATSVLVKDIYPDFVYQHLNIFMFRTNYGNTLAESIEYAKSLGLPTVPYETYKFEFSTYSEYEAEITSLIWKYKLMMEEQGIPTDGLVLQINQRDVFNKHIKDGFIEGGSLAVKAVGWEPGVYQSEVVDIIIEPSVFQCCTKAIIKPVTTDSGKRLSVVNLFNPATLFNNKIKVGSIIEFNYKNETTSDFIRKIE
jgi:NAD-dependent DNA ligase